MTDDEIQAEIAKLSPEEREQLRKLALIARAGHFTVPGFESFYELVHGNALPKHGREEVEEIFEAHKEDRGALLWAWRGSWKTTTISITFTAYFMGHHPDRANLVIGANDDSAKMIAETITDIIKQNDAWKMVFPNVAPDEGKGWGAGGYEIMRTDVDYNQWRTMNSHRKDPSLLGLGITSKSLIGKHPDGVLLMDDIHDEENSSSGRQRQAIVNKVTGTILPFIVEDAAKPAGERLQTWTIGVGTPWADDDAYHYLKESGEFRFKAIPGITPAEEGALGAIHITKEDTQHMDLWGWWYVTFPGRIDKQTIISWRNRSGARDFARMYRLDLKASQETGLKYQLYPAEKINIYEWIMGGGCDYASIRSRVERQHTNRDLFALVYIARVPTGGAVIVDGVAGHLTMAEADEKIEVAQRTFPMWTRTAVEDIGKGETFVDSLLLKPHLRIVPMTSRIPKIQRHEKGLGPLLENGILRVSDADTPFLNLFRDSLDKFPDGNDDVRDGAFFAAKLFPDLWQLPNMDETDAPYRRRQTKRRNPFAALAKV